MPKVAVILLHLGEGHDLSRSVLERIERSKVSGISEIRVRSNKLKEWLTHNSHGIEVTSFPAFLVAQDGKRTQVYQYQDVDKIIDMIRELTSE